jgi:hypothetical protein
MSISDKLVLRGLQPYLPEGAEVLVVERVTTDALGEEHAARAVLTTDDLFVVTRVRLKSILTQVPRADIRSVEARGPDAVAIGFEDYARARHRVINLGLAKQGDRRGLLAALGAVPGEGGAGASDTPETP